MNHNDSNPLRDYELEIADIDRGIVQAAIFNQLLPVTAHDALRWGVAVRVEDGRGRQQRNVRGIEHASVQNARTLEAHQDLAVREQRVLVKAHLALDRTHVHNADVHTFGVEGIRSAEVVQLLELRGDVGAHHHPVSGTTQGGSVDDVSNFERLVHQGDVTVGEVNRGTSSGGEVVLSTDRSRNDEVVDDFPVDFGDHFISHQVGQGALSVDVMHRLEVLSGFQRPRGLQLTGDGGNRVAVDRQGDFRLERVAFEVILVVDASDGRRGEATVAQNDINSAGGVVEVAGVGINRDGFGETGAIADNHNVRVTISVVGNAEAR